MGAVFLNSFSAPSAVAPDSLETVMDARSLVLTPNDQKSPKESYITVKDLVPFGGSSSTPSTSLVDMHDGIGILKFLRGKGFFITGATGFLAKDIEDSAGCGEDISLDQGKKTKEAAMERLKTEITNAELFKCLRQTYGKSYQSFMLSKLVPVVGNVCESDLGIEDDVAGLISKEVDVIVNSAANTTFHERYDVAIDINTKGPCHLMAFAKKCKKLKLFLQVSTDMVANAMLAAIANHGMAQKQDINIYQINSSVANPLDFQELSELLYEHYNSSPCVDAKGRPIQVPSMKLFSSMEDFSAHIWRDALQQSGLTALSSSNGKLSQKLEMICRKSVEQAKFDNSNTERMMERMSEEEKRKFGFDVGSIDWKDYITNVHIPGLKRHVLKSCD
ncbi:hypothetical protein C1H46_015312 [Malus baccata]|uniref:Fatty acyl-CoA reductase n=1 Tax=Malus baccata TaxID=106549 RepID=A0A540MJT3_MALBA|nr:hypothetical protein C1H46_015312 [Malus baccata]